MVENEIQYLSWKEFQQMTPAILSLEVTRLGKLLAEDRWTLVDRNELVRARHALLLFIHCVSEAKRPDLESCSSLIEASYLHAAAVARDVSLPALDYVVDRLRTIRGRMSYIY